jgi:hypothetical protein
VTTPLHAIPAGISPPKNGETRTTAPTVSGLLDNESQRRKSSVQGNPLQVVAERMDAFKRLEQSFSRAGWALYPLSDDSLLATYARWGLSQVLPDARAAAVFLRKIGGAA